MIFKINQRIKELDSTCKLRSFYHPNKEKKRCLLKTIYIRVVDPLIHDDILFHSIMNQRHKYYTI